MLLRLVEVVSRGHAMSPLLNARVTLLRWAYATAFGMVEVARRSCKRMEARNTLRNRLVVWFTEVLTYLSVLLFDNIIS